MARVTYKRIRTPPTTGNFKCAHAENVHSHSTINFCLRYTHRMHSWLALHVVAAWWGCVRSQYGCIEYVHREPVPYAHVHVLESCWNTQVACAGSMHELWRSYINTPGGAEKAFLPLGRRGSRNRSSLYSSETASLFPCRFIRAMRKPCIHAFYFQAMADLSPPVSPESTANSSTMDMDVKVGGY